MFGKLIAAASEGRSSEVKRCLKNESDVDERDDYRRTALHWAAQTNRIGTAKVLLKNRAMADLRDFDGATPLFVACSMGHVCMARILIEKGSADMNQCAHHGLPPLVIAAREGHLQIVKLLVEKGVDLRKQDREGYTALMAAVNWGRLDIVKFLVENGVDPVHTECRDMHNAVTLAGFNRNLEIAKYFHKCGYDLMLVDNSGFSCVSASLAYESYRIAGYYFSVYAIELVMIRELCPDSFLHDGHLPLDMFKLIVDEVKQDIVGE